MTIDYTTVKLYTCCKCGHRWTNWDRLKQQDSEHLPKNCPHCRNVRWNQDYTKDDIILIKKLEEQHVIRHEAKKEKSAYAALLGKDEEIERHYADLDFVAYDFLYAMQPNPDAFEIRQKLKIPKSRIEDRHELMFSMMRDRMTNKERYDQEYFSKLSEFSRNKWSNWSAQAFVNVKMRRRMKGCKCQEEVDLLAHQYKNHIYHAGSTPGFDMTDSEVLMLPGSETIEAEAAVKAIKVNEAELEAIWNGYKEEFKAKYMGKGYWHPEEVAERLANGDILNWKKYRAEKERQREERNKKWEEQERKQEERRVSILTKVAKEMFAEGREAGQNDTDIAESFKKIALEKNFSEEQIDAIIQQVTQGQKEEEQEREDEEDSENE